MDALRVINAIGRVLPEGELVAAVERESTDVNGDGRTTAIDALMVINQLGSQSLRSEIAIDLIADDDDDEDDRVVIVDLVFASELN